jgi:hypothetical protein
MFRVDPKTVTRWAKAGKLTSIRTLRPPPLARPRCVLCSPASPPSATVPDWSRTSRL